MRIAATFRTLPVARPIWASAILRLQAENSVVASTLLRFPKVFLENVSLVKLIKYGFGRVVSATCYSAVLVEFRMRRPVYERSLKPGDNAQGEGLTSLAKKPRRDISDDHRIWERWSGA